jgi:hypothetical protein
MDWKSYVAWRWRNQQLMEQDAREAQGKRAWYDLSHDHSEFIAFCRRANCEVETTETGWRVFVSPYEWRGLWGSFRDQDDEAD